MVSGLSDFAIYDPAIGGCDGLFVPKRSKGQALHDVGRAWDKGVISFKGEQLTSVHQSVLLAICAQTARNGLFAGSNGNFVEASQEALLFDNSDKDLEMSFLEVSAYYLLMDAGMGTGGNDYKNLISILHEMSTVSLLREVPGKKKRISPLILFPKPIEGDKLHIRLNWRLAVSIFCAQNVRVSLNERRRLSSPIAKIAHCWFSSFIREGQSLMAGRGAKLQTLAEHVWGNRIASDGTWRNRRSSLKRALLTEVGQLHGWAITEEPKKSGKYCISRPKQMPNCDDSYFQTPSENAEFMDSIQESTRSQKLYFEDEIGHFSWDSKKSKMSDLS